MNVFFFCLCSYVWYFPAGNGGNSGSVTLHYRKLNGRIQSQVCGGTGAEPANNGQGGNGNYNFFCYGKLTVIQSLINQGKILRCH